MSFLKVREEMINLYGPEVSDRRTGKTTACCFSILAEAMMNIETPVKLRDHYSNEPKNLRFNTSYTLKKIIQELGLEGFTFNTRDLTITYSLEACDEKI